MPDRVPMLTRAEAATYLGVPFHTLEQWASRHCGPAYYKIGGRVRYRVADLDAWLESRRCDPQTGQAQKTPLALEPVVPIVQQHVVAIARMQKRRG